MAHKHWHGRFASEKAAVTRIIPDNEFVGEYIEIAVNDMLQPFGLTH